MQKLIFSFSVLLASTVAFPETCPCPTSYSIIEIGKTSLDEVLKTCCKPVSQKTYKASVPAPQKWSYSIVPPANPANAVQGSVELTVIFDETEKVTNLTVNAQSLTSTNCGNTSTVSYDVVTPNTIQVGNTMDMVKSICGKPQFITKGVPSEENQEAPTVTELKYAGFIGSPPVTLIFNNAILKEIKK